MSRHRNFKQPEPQRITELGRVVADSLGREFVVVQPGCFSVTCRQIGADGTMSKVNVTLSLDGVKPTSKKITIHIEDLQ